MNEIIDEAVSILERSVDRRIIIRKELKAASTMILGDPTMLQNAVLNLALNARDAMPRVES